MRRIETSKAVYLSQSALYKTSLPWVTQEMEATRALMGKNYWPYGIEPNREALTTFFDTPMNKVSPRGPHDQGAFPPFWSSFDRIVGIGPRSNRVSYPIAGSHFLNNLFGKEADICLRSQ